MLYEDAKALLVRYKEGKCTDAENALVERWLFQFENENSDLSEERIQEISKEIWLSLPKQSLKIIKGLQLARIAAAATILVFLLAGLYFIIIAPRHKQLGVKYTKDLLPGSNKAILTLSNGKKIILNNAGIGTIGSEGNAVINKTANGEIVYSSTETAADNGSLAYNTITIPNGGQYHLVLSDGTNVWLDAASSIKYPTVFTGNERKVVITGEAYFEVAHNAAKPFRVMAQGQTVEVLGTHFNIDAYTNEPVIKTTLLEGSVKVTNNMKTITLAPGEQAQVQPGTADNEIKVLNNVDTDEAIAWKNGLFQFNKASIESIMRQVARWYDVEISYMNNKIPSKTFTGSISRNSSASQVLEILSYTGLHFEIAGKKIIVITE
jgi:ferric-dicitrate binding protein FerR (iron transport regulator)